MSLPMKVNNLHEQGVVHLGVSVLNRLQQVNAVLRAKHVTYLTPKRLDNNRVLDIFRVLINHVVYHFLVDHFASVYHHAVSLDLAEQNNQIIIGEYRVLENVVEHLLDRAIVVLQRIQQYRNAKLKRALSNLLQNQANARLVSDLATFFKKGRHLLKFK